jgi:alcohol dehydrogenase class IV
LGVIHGIAHPLGALYQVPHGLACAACLLPSIRLNRDVMGDKYDKMGVAVMGDFAEKTEALLKTLNIISPFRGKPVLEKELIIRETLASGSTAANPKAVAREDVEFLLSELF